MVRSRLRNRAQRPQVYIQVGDEHLRAIRTKKGQSLIVAKKRNAAGGDKIGRTYVVNKGCC